MTLPKYFTTVTPFSKTIALILFIAFPVVGFAMGIRYQALIDTYQTKNTSYVPTQVSTPTPAIKKTKLVTSEQPLITFEKNYTSSLGYKFEYPNNWNISRFVVLKGEKNQRSNRYDVNATNNNVEVVNITSDNWTIEIHASKADKTNSCGGQGPISGELLKSYKYFTVFNQDAARMDLENGQYWARGDQPEPYPQPIMFPVDSNLSEEVKVRIGITGNAYQFIWCPQATTNNPVISITYYSDRFTNQNFKNKTINSKMINEMDNILRTFKFL